LTLLVGFRLGAVPRTRHRRAIAVSGGTCTF
jgi:hypothetical protein